MTHSLRDCILLLPNRHPEKFLRCKVLWSQLIYYSKFHYARMHRLHLFIVLSVGIGKKNVARIYQSCQWPGILQLAISAMYGMPEVTPLCSSFQNQVLCYPHLYSTLLSTISKFSWDSPMHSLEFLSFQLVNNQQILRSPHIGRCWG